KIKAVLKGQEKDLLEEVEERIIVRKNLNPLRAHSKSKFLPTILQAIGQKSVLSVEYHSFYKGEQTRRCLEPMGIFYESGNWLLIAYCSLMGDYRVFRIDRTRDLPPTKEHLIDQHAAVTEYLDALSKENPLVKAGIRMKKEVCTDSKPI